MRARTLSSRSSRIGRSSPPNFSGRQCPWPSAVSGSFNHASDWSTDTVPGSADTAALAASGANYTVTSSVNNTINTLEAAANATLDISAGTFAVTNFADNLGSIEVGPGAALALGTAGAGMGFTNSGTDQPRRRIDVRDGCQDRDQGAIFYLERQWKPDAFQQRL